MKQQHLKGAQTARSDAIASQARKDRRPLWLLIQ
jgi:hypothetical protein